MTLVMPHAAAADAALTWPLTLSPLTLTLSPLRYNILDSLILVSALPCLFLPLEVPLLLQLEVPALVSAAYMCQPDQPASPLCMSACPVQVALPVFRALRPLCIIKAWHEGQHSTSNLLRSEVMVFKTQPTP